MTLIRIIGGNSIPATGAHTHFDTYKGSVLQAEGLRDQGEIDALAPNPNADKFVYDATIDGAVYDLTDKDPPDIPSGNQLNVQWTRAGITNNAIGAVYGAGSSIPSPPTDTLASIQWEWRMSSGWNAAADRSPVNVYKAFRIDYTDHPGKYWIQYNAVMDDTADDVPAIPLFRSPNTTQPESRDGDLWEAWDPNPTNINKQPGTLTSANLTSEPHALADHLANADEPFLIRPNVWVRTTINVNFVSSTEVNWTVIMSDEDNDPVNVFTRLTDNTKGWNAYRPDDATFNAENVFNKFLIEFDTSQDASGPMSGSDLKVWVRNVLIDVGGYIPHGGRPIP